MTTQTKTKETRRKTANSKKQNGCQQKTKQKIQNTQIKVIKTIKEIYMGQLHLHDHETHSHMTTCMFVH